MFAICCRPRKRRQAFREAPLPTVRVVPPATGAGGGHVGGWTRAARDCTPGNTWMKDRKQRSCRFSLVAWLYILLLQKSANTLLLYSNSFKYPWNKFLLFDKSSLSDICPHPDSVRTRGRLNRQISCCRAFPEACLEAPFLQECFREPSWLVVLQPLRSVGQAADTRPHTRAASGVSSPAVTPAPHVFAKLLPGCCLRPRPVARPAEEPGRPWWSGPASPAPAVLCPSLVMLEASPLSPAPCGLCLVSLGSGPGSPPSVRMLGGKAQAPDLSFCRLFFIINPVLEIGVSGRKHSKISTTFFFNLRNVTFGF